MHMQQNSYSVLSIWSLFIVEHIFCFLQPWAQVTHLYMKTFWPWWNVCGFSYTTRLTLRFGGETKHQHSFSFGKNSKYNWESTLSEKGEIKMSELWLCLKRWASETMIRVKHDSSFKKKKKSFRLQSSALLITWREIHNLLSTRFDTRIIVLIPK